MKAFLRTAAYALTRKRINEDKLDIIRISVREDRLSYFSLSTNPIISFEYEGKLLYFRACPRIMGKRDYFLNETDAFFERVSRFGISEEHFKEEIFVRTGFREDEISRFYEYLNGRKKDPDFIKAMSRADVTGERLSFSVWEKRVYEKSFFDAFSLTELDGRLYDIAVLFLWNMRSAAMTYRTLGIVRGNRHSFFSGVRAVASRIVAEELGLESLVTDAVLCILETESGETLGVLSPSAAGSRMSDTDTVLCGSLQRELLRLNALDMICLQPDHGPNNYNVYEENGEYRLCAFDNDNPRTFFPDLFADGAFRGCVPLVGRDMTVKREIFDKETSDKIKNTDVKRLQKRLRPYLNVLQIYAVIRRLKKLGKAIEKTEKQRAGFLIEADAFNEYTAGRELAAENTYLSKAMENRPKGATICHFSKTKLS